MNIYIKVIVSFFIGCFVGILAHAKDNKRIKKPRNLKNYYDLGVIWDILVSGLAAVVMVLISDPSEMGRVILTSILSGWAGEKILVNLTSKEKLEHLQDINQQLDLPIEQNEKKTHKK